jgi:hypothetical protein
LQSHMNGSQRTLVTRFIAAPQFNENGHSCYFELFASVKNGRTI